MRVTVVGAGIVGLATADALVRRGHRVTVLEAHRPMGARSAGASRIFRLAHGDPELVAAATEARRLWDDWSERAGRPLLGEEGAVVSGPRVDEWAAAMIAAGAAHEVGHPPSGTLGRTDGPVLHDPAGGALDLAGAGRMLQEALREHLRPGRVVDLDEFDADAIVLTAGAGTAELAAQRGIAVPDELCHHVRFAFRLREQPTAVPPAHLDGTPGPALASTYQHRTPEGHWAIGGHLPDELTTTADHSLDDVRRRSLDAIVAHVRERIGELDPEPVGEVTCTPTAGEGDGVRTARVGNVHALWGGNLAKFAPLLGERLAEAVVHDHVAHAIGPPDDPADHGR
ncbi:NAD(P)/FAD-dependent oxidoreductase [Actinomycetospora termitidis]|uniref:FAD-dependent oxidoreductase n=1 Tax=Actinomycetospora termitidis TaxID=3053470 RepID=A0ABT7MB72_9PSEU|nr:FAD-dependent oxidoreductase [Actinomycetospora sp. Odt1-22]MDL5157912.1 FAD-dependent oxidoreductase [Actinomycetospora sp. Odt1-22]